MQPLVYIIVILFNGKQWITECLNSVLRTNYQNFKILIIDNASNDNGLDLIKDNFKNIQHIRSSKNLGFAGASNMGIRKALKEESDYIVLLNQDTKVDPDWIIELIKVAENNNKIGVITPMQYDYAGNNLDNHFKPLLDASFNVNPEFSKTQNIIGAAIFLTNKFCQEVGIFDSIYFCYYEEADLCRRAIYHGYSVGIAKKSIIYHWHTLASVKKVNRKIGYLLTRNEMFYEIKNPYYPIIINLYNFFLKKIKSSFKNRNIVFGYLFFLKKLCYLLPVLLYLPILSIKRKKEITKCIKYF